MAKHLKLGREGEQIAKLHLISLGYEILETNWRFRRAEIDIIAKHNNILVFVEVKTGTYNVFSSPEEAVNDKKKNLLLDAGSRYMVKINHEWEIRFDIISITYFDKVEYKITHFKDAFFN